MTDTVDPISAHENEHLIEVLVPFVRGIPHLIAALRSVLAQDDHGWMLTVLDNCGPEPEARDHVESLDDQRITYRRFDDHLPMAQNWNRCIAYSRSPLFVLLHSDDEWEPGFISGLKRLAADHPTAAALFTAGHTIDSDGARRRSLPDSYKAWLIGRGHDDLVLRGDDGLARLLRGNFLFASSMCFRREKLSAVPYRTDLSFAPDYELALRLLVGGGEIAGARRDLCRYRRHGSQATLELTKGSQRFAEELAIYADFGRQANARGWSRSTRAASRHASLRINLLIHAAQRARQSDWTGATSDLHAALRPSAVDVASLSDRPCQRS